MQQLLEEIYRLLPNATVLLSTVTVINETKCAAYCPSDMLHNIETFNAQLPSVVVQPLQARGNKLLLHDVNAGARWEEKDFYTLGIHFTQQGFQKIANAWYGAITNISAKLPLVAANHAVVEDA